MDNLVIIGAGTAGVPCAITAAQAGASVLLLDKASDIGGTMHVSGGHISAAGTRRQRQRGISDSPDTHLRDVLRISHGSAREDLVRLAVDHAASTVDWLEDLGLHLAEETPALVYGHEVYSVPRTHWGDDEARSILDVLRPELMRTIQSGRVKLRLDSRVTRLVRKRDRIIAAEVQSEDGSLALCEGDAFVLATGGYGYSEELLAELDGAPYVTAAWPTSTGDGLLLARDAGAAWQGADSYLPTFGGLPHDTGESRVTRWFERPHLVPQERPPWEIFVDRNGRRWIAEDEPSIDKRERGLLCLPGMTFWTVFDARAIRESQPMVVSWSPDELMRKANRRPGVFMADTLDRLALSAGIEPGGLRSTLQAYNSSVRAGADLDFGRRYLPACIAEPPFFALQNHATTFITFTGVDVAADLRVRRADGSAFENLYAAGEVLGAASTSGNAFCGGMLFGPALAFGRLLGARVGAATAPR